MIWLGLVVPERVFISMSSHKTRSVFDRCSIVKPAALKVTILRVKMFSQSQKMLQ